MRGLSVLLLLASAAAGGPEAPPPVSAEEFAKLHAALLPGKEPAAWETIPWKTDLMAARAQAEREEKLLFLWTMNGHPLGCT